MVMVRITLRRRRHRSIIRLSRVRRVIHLLICRCSPTTTSTFRIIISASNIGTERMNKEQGTVLKYSANDWLLLLSHGFIPSSVVQRVSPSCVYCINRTTKTHAVYLAVACTDINTRRNSRHQQQQQPWYLLQWHSTTMAISAMPALATRSRRIRIEFQRCSLFFIFFYRSSVLTDLAPCSFRIDLNRARHPGRTHTACRFHCMKWIFILIFCTKNRNKKKICGCHGNGAILPCNNQR